MIVPLSRARSFWVITAFIIVYLGQFKGLSHIVKAL